MKELVIVFIGLMYFAFWFTVALLCIAAAQKKMTKLMDQEVEVEPGVDTSKLKPSVPKQTTPVVSVTDEASEQ